MQVCDFVFTPGEGPAGLRQHGPDFRVGDRVWVLLDALPRPVLAFIHLCSVDLADGVLRAEFEVYDEDAELLREAVGPCGDLTIVAANVPSQSAIRACWESVEARPKKWWQRWWWR